jgi:dextranase
MEELAQWETKAEFFVDAKKGSSLQQPSTQKFGELRAFHSTLETIIIEDVPQGSVRVCALLASGESMEATHDGQWKLTNLFAGTYAVQAIDDSGRLLGEIITTVGINAGERPVHGFATSFTEDDIPSVLEWHRSLRSTVVQVYDWMASYTEPLGPSNGWNDPSNRPVSLDALRSLAIGLQDQGSVAHAYVPIYAVGHGFANLHPEMLMYEDNGVAIRFMDQIVLANPGNEAWQRHFVESYGSAAEAIGFNGFHVDTYGYPRIAFDADGNTIDMRSAYESFLRFARSAWPDTLISFNQVNGVPSGANLPPGPRFRYCEIWPPNDAWRHFEGLLDRSSGVAGRLGPNKERTALLRGSIACYPPVWGIDGDGGPVKGPAREDSLRTDVLTEAITTQLGASALIYGDRGAALCDPYYPKHAVLSADERDEVIAWRHFSLRCRDLFLHGEDTSWYEIDDENGAVGIEADVRVSPEPVGGSVFARVVHADTVVTVGVVDLTGSVNGKWSEPASHGTVSSVTVRVLVDHPNAWTPYAAVLGAKDEHFAVIESVIVPHRQGRALEVTLPLVEGWSVLRLNRNGRNSE